MEVKPFSIGDKVRCIKVDAWRDNAGLGDTIDGGPIFGGIYTVSYIDKLTPEYEGQPDNGITWAMTLEEFPELEPTNEPHNVYSCRRFELVKG